MTKEDATKAAQWLENRLLRRDLTEAFLTSLRNRIKHLDIALANPLLKEVPVAYKAIRKKRAELATALRSQGVKP